MSGRDESIEARVREWYDAQHPSPETLEKARLATRTAPPTEERRSVIAAAAAVLALISFVWIINRDLTWADADGAATEIAKNHSKGSAPVFIASTIEALGPSMRAKLGFDPVTPALLSARWDLAVTGGRYCSVDGAVAAQVSCRLPNGRRATLYLWRCPGEVPTSWRSRHAVSDVQVTIWREGPLLAGLAEPR